MVLDFNLDNNMSLLVLAAVILVVLAVISTIGVNLFVGNGSCTGILGQEDYGCVQNQAFSTSNASMCAGLPSQYSDQCYVNIAENTSNRALCNNVQDQNLSSDCVAYIANSTGNATLCKNLPAGSQSNCVDSIALGDNNMSACSDISNKYNSSACSIAVYLSTAISGNTTALCKNVPKVSRININDALDLISAYSNSSSQGPLQLLNYLTLSNLSIGPEDFCYTALAYASMNKSDCIYTSARANNICIALSTKPNTTMTANTLNYSSLYNLCQQQYSGSECNDTIYYLQAVTANSITQCQALPDFAAQQCYYTLAQKYNNTSYCSYITNQTINNICLTTINGQYRTQLNSTP